MAKIARGKALVAKLRAQAGVRDAEALAAHLGRFKKARKAGASVAEAQKMAKGEKRVGSGSLADRVRSSSSPKSGKKVSVLAKRPKVDDDDPFGEDFGPNEEQTPEQRRQRKMEEAILRKMEQEDTARLFEAVRGQGGIRPSSPDLAEEYRNVPKSYRSTDGLRGDEMADHFARFYPDLGIESENDLLDFFANRTFKYRSAA